MREEVLEGLGFEVFALKDRWVLGVIFELELHVFFFYVNLIFLLFKIP